MTASVARRVLTAGVCQPAELRAIGNRSLPVLSLANCLFAWTNPDGSNDQSLQSDHGIGALHLSLRLDMVAGLTAAAVVLPKAMAYATVAGCL